MSKVVDPDLLKRDLYADLSSAELRVDKDSTPDEIKKAYRKVSRTCHPDIVSSRSNLSAAEKAELVDRFRTATAAYEVLSDAENRERYNKSLRFVVKDGAAIAAELERWSEADSNEPARKLSTSYSIGDRVVARGHDYSIELVTFGEGDQMVARAALCVDGYVLENDRAAPSSHEPAPLPLHKEFCQSRNALRSRFSELEGMRAEAADKIKMARETLREGDGLPLGRLTYSVKPIAYQPDGQYGKWRAHLGLCRGEICLSPMPEGSAPAQLMANVDDLDEFLSEWPALQNALTQFKSLRDSSSQRSLQMTAHLERGDGFNVNGTRYEYKVIECKAGEADKAWLSLCAGDSPLAYFEGRPVAAAQRGIALETLQKFVADDQELVRQINELLRLRRELASEVRVMARDLKPGEGIQLGDQIFDVREVTRNFGRRDVTYTLLCWGDVCVGHWASMLDEGLRSPSLEEARWLRRVLPEIKLEFGLQPPEPQNEAPKQKGGFLTKIFGQPNPGGGLGR